jgi:hypothetical protein
MLLLIGWIVVQVMKSAWNLLRFLPIALFALLVISGMVVVCIAIGVWLVDLWVVFPLFDFGLLIQLLLGFVLMVVATATALVALVRSTITLRAISATPNNTSSLPQRDRTDSKVWIMVLSLGLFAFIGTIMLIFVHVGPIMFLLLSLFAGLVSMMNALAMKKNRVEIADLSNQEPL